LPADLAGAELGYYKKAVNIMVKWDGDVEATDVSASHCGLVKDAKYVMSVRQNDPATKLLSLGDFVAPLETPRLKKHDRFRFPLIGDRWFDLERHQKTVEVTYVTWQHGEGVFYAVSGIGDDTRTYYGSVKYAEYLYSYTRKVDGKNCLVIVIKDDTSRRSRNLVMFIKDKEEVKLIMHELRRYNRVTLNKLDIPRGTESE
jgi:hypothetical protein